MLSHLNCCPLPFLSRVPTSASCHTSDNTQKLFVLLMILPIRTMYVYARSEGGPGKGE